MIDVIGNAKLEQTYDSCQLGKLSRLPFSHSKHFSTSIFDKIHCDLWDLPLFYLLENLDIMHV